MGFLKSLTSVANNQKTFKEWEKEDKNKKAQREALNQKNYLDAKTLQNAQSKGKVIMDVVDIMDTHSEEVAENVEESVIPFVMIVPELALIGAAWLANRYAIEPLSEKRLDADLDFVNKNKKLIEMYDKLLKMSRENKNLNTDLAKLDLDTNITSCFKNLFGSTTKECGFLNKKNLEIFEKTNDENLKEYKELFKQLFEKYNADETIKSYPKKIKTIVAAFAAASVMMFVGINVLGAKLQVRSSRIARWQSRQDLENPKYFVQYTPEQIALAKANLEKNENEDKNKKSSLLSFKGKISDSGGLKNREGFFKSIGGVIKDNKSYVEWKDNYNVQDKKVERPLSEQELVEAKKEQEVIQRITKQINNKAEDYAENMEVASGVLIQGTPFLGMGVGFVMSKLSQLFGIEKMVNKKSLDNLVKDLDEESAKKVREFFANSTKKVVKNNKEVDKIDFFYMIRNIDDFGSALFNGYKEAGNVKKRSGINKIFDVVFATKKGYAAVLTMVGGLVTGIVGSIIGLKLQKAASRAGRFKAKQEISQNPQNFIGYTQEEYETVKDVKAQKKNPLQKMGEYLMFVPNCVKDYLEYQKYRKNVANNEKKLLEELVKLDVTPEQLKEAKELQRKVFTTFESVDDKSQEYSESMETINEMSKPLIPVFGVALAATPVAITALLNFKKGKGFFIEKITSFLAKHTKLLSGKIATNYANDVAQNIHSVVEGQYIPPEGVKIKIPNFKNISGENVDIKDVENIEIDAKDVVNLLKLGKQATIKSVLDVVQKYLPEEVAEMINNIYSQLELSGAKVGDVLNLLANKDILKERLEIEDTSITVRKLISQKMNNNEEIMKPIFEMLNKYDILDKDIDSVIDELLNNEKLKQAINQPISELKIDFTKYIPKVKEEVQKGAKVANSSIKGAIASGVYRKGLEKIVNNEGIPYSLRKIANNVLNGKASDEQVLKIYQNIVTIVQNMPAKQVDVIFKAIKEEYEKNPEKLIKAMKNGSLSTTLLTLDMIKGVAIASTTWTAICLLAEFALESMFASMQKQAGRLGVMEGLKELDAPEYYANVEKNENNENISVNGNAKKYTVAKKNETISPFLQQYIKK